MNHHDSEDDFLTKLYKKTARETPPAKLDKLVLDMAKANHQHQRYTKTLNLQRVLSVAAAMVFSIYIFFDLDEDRSENRNEGFIYSQPDTFNSSPASPQLERLDMNDKAQAVPLAKKKASKISAESEMADIIKDDISELAAEAAEQTMDEMTTPNMLLAPSLTQQPLKQESTDDSVKAEDLLKKIQQLIAIGEKEKARTIYAEFKQLFPDYPVPVFISEGLK